MNNDVVFDKLKKIYMVDDGYQELSEEDKNFFDRLFTLLWINEDIFYSNKYLAAKFGYGESTIEKKLRKIERSFLIYREIYRENQKGKWISQRRITLDPTLKAKLYSKLNLIPKEEAKEKELAPEQVEEIINKNINDVEFIPNYRRR